MRSHLWFISGVLPAGDAEYVGPVLIEDALGIAHTLRAEFKQIEHRVVDEDGRGHVVWWWGRIVGPHGPWCDETFVNREIDVQFLELRPRRALVVRIDAPKSVQDDLWSMWAYGLDEPPWLQDPAGGDPAGVREPRNPPPSDQGLLDYRDP